MTDPFSDLEINCRAQLSILEACRQHNPSVRIVYAGTRQVYGHPDYLPVREDHPIRPVDVNGIHKVAGESYHLLYGRVYGMQTSALRLTNTYGPHMRVKDARQTFLGIWIAKAVQDEPFEVWGGDQLRDFTYVEDAVSAFGIASAPEDQDGVFNFGGGEVVTLGDLAALVVRIAGSGCSVRDFPPERKRIDIGDYYADCSAIDPQSVGSRGSHSRMASEGRSTSTERTWPLPLMNPIPQASPGAAVAERRDESWRQSRGSLTRAATSLVRRCRRSSRSSQPGLAPLMQSALRTDWMPLRSPSARWASARATVS